MKAIYFAIFYSVIALSGMADAQDTAAGQACTEDQILLATGSPDTSYSKVAKDIIASCPMIWENCCRLSPLTGKRCISSLRPMAWW